MQMSTLSKYVKSNQNEFIMETNALKEPLIYLFLMMWCDELVTTVLACYNKILTVCRII